MRNHLPMLALLAASPLALGQTKPSLPGLASAGWPARGGGYGSAYAGRGPAAQGRVGAPLTVGNTRAVATVGPDGTLHAGSDTKVAARGAANWEAANGPLAVCDRLFPTQGGALVARTTDGLFACGAAAGKPLWTFRPNPAGLNDVASRSVGRDGTVFARLEESLHALDGKTGAARWRASGGSAQVVGDDGSLLGTVARRSGRLKRSMRFAVSCSPADGSERRASVIGEPFEAVSDAAAGGPGAVATTADGTLYCALGEASPFRSVPAGLPALDPATGGRRRQVGVAGAADSLDPALADDGAVYLPLRNGRVYPVR